MSILCTVSSALVYVWCDMPSGITKENESLNCYFEMISFNIVQHFLFRHSIVCFLNSCATYIQTE